MNSRFESLRLVAAGAVTAIAFAAAPSSGRAQPASPPPKATLAEAQQVFQEINADPAKLKAYCDLDKLNAQMAAADEKKDTKTLEALGAQADAIAQKVGPGYIKLMNGLDGVDENSPLGKQIAAGFDSLDKKCE